MMKTELFWKQFWNVIGIIGVVIGIVGIILAVLKILGVF